jgi:protein-disulfide isomerase
MERSMSKKSWIILGVIVVLLIGGGAAWYFLNGSGDALSASASSSLAPDQVHPDDKTMGNPKAAVVLVEYFAQDCSVCAAFDQQVFPQLKAKYIDTGKVYYVMRLFPLYPLDGQSYKLDLCVPPEHFFQAVDLLFRNQPQWDSAEYQGVDANAGLHKMAHILGMSDEQADKCMNDTGPDAHINQVAEDGNTRYQIQGTPAFAIDFKKANINSWDDAQKLLDAELAAKGAK